jgi:glycosyltransferase involved in cell wall biosynthesis
MLSILLPNHNEKKINLFIEEVEKILPAHEIIIASDRVGRGKGWAVREALQHAKGDQIAFLDSDGDIPPRMLLRLIPFLDDFDVVVGSKRITKAPLHRKIITHLSRIYIRLFFGLVVDTQTGIKLFRREAIEEWKTDGFFFDVEILAKAKRKCMRMIEVPIEVEIKEKMSGKILWRTLCESLCLMFRLLFHAGK